MSTIILWFSENMANISRRLAEFEEVMQAKLGEEIACQTSFKNLYIQEKAKTGKATLEGVRCREQVNELQEELTHAIMRRVILRSEIRDEYEEIAIERVAFTTAKKRLTE